MKLKKLSCPSCGANINMEMGDNKTVFCPFCGNQFAVDNEESVQTKNLNIHARFTNDAEVMKEIKEDRENERRHKDSKRIYLFSGLMFLLAFAIFFGMFGMLSCDEQKRHENERQAIDAGMIKIGRSSSSFEGMKYQAAVSELELAGYTNISTIDLDDAGLFKNKKDTIERVAINGKTSFSSDDYFSPDAQIVISYH